MTTAAPLQSPHSIKRTISAERVTAMRGAVCADARLNPPPPDVVFSLIVWEQMAGEKWNGRLPGDLLLVTRTCYHGDCPLIAGGH